MSINAHVTSAYMKGRVEPISQVRHDVYPSISPNQGLQDSARGLKVLITGGGRGVGRCTALYFAQAGAAKITITARTGTELDQTKQAINDLGLGTRVICVTGAVNNQVDVARAFDAAEEVDVLVHNAGIAGVYCPLHESNIDTWWQVYEVNVKGTYLFNREFLRRATGSTNEIERPITIVNLTSRSALSTFPGASGYSSAKCAINRLVEYIHVEYPKNVRVFGLHPGAIPTALSFSVLAESARDGLVDTVDVAAGAILWLATQSKADFLNGRYMSANWDVDEVVKHRQEILEKKLLFTTVVGGTQAWT